MWTLCGPCVALFVIKKPRTVFGDLGPGTAARLGSQRPPSTMAMRLSVMRSHLLGRPPLLRSRLASSLSMQVNEQGVAVLRLDVPGEKQNTLSDDVVGEFSAAMDKIEADPTVRAAVLISAKPGSFVAGANIKSIEALGNSTKDKVNKSENIRVRREA